MDRPRCRRPRNLRACPTDPSRCGEDLAASLVEPRVRDLHIRIDGPAEGRRAHTCRDGEPAALGAGTVPARPFGRRAAQDAVHLRRLGVGVVLAPPCSSTPSRGHSGRPQGPRVPGADHRRRTGHHGPLRSVDARGVHPCIAGRFRIELRTVFAAGEALPMDTCDGSATPCTARLYNWYGPAEAEIVSRLAPNPGADGDPDRHSGIECAGPRPRSTTATGSGGCGGRAVSRR